MKYKMVIFDLDGTLCDTIKDLFSACNYALKKCGLEEITLEETRQYVGNGIKNLMLQASKNKGNIEELLHYFKEYYSKNYALYTKPYPHIEDVIVFCQKQKLTIGVWTNKSEDIAKKIIDRLFGDSFSFVYGEISGRKKKPEVDFLYFLLKKYDLKKEEVLYIGDSEVDIKTVENSAISGIFVSYGFRKKEELLAYTNKIVDEPLELIKYIGE